MVCFFVVSSYGGSARATPVPFAVAERLRRVEQGLGAVAEGEPLTRLRPRGEPVRETRAGAPSSSPLTSPPGGRLEDNVDRARRLRPGRRPHERGGARRSLAASGIAPQARTPRTLPRAHAWTPSSRGQSELPRRTPVRRRSRRPGPRAGSTRRSTPKCLHPEADEEARLLARCAPPDELARGPIERPPGRPSTRGCVARATGHWS